MSNFLTLKPNATLNNHKGASVKTLKSAFVSAASNLVHYTDFSDNFCIPELVQEYVLYWLTLGRSFKLPIHAEQSFVYDSLHGKKRC